MGWLGNAISAVGNFFSGLFTNKSNKESVESTNKSNEAIAANTNATNMMMNQQNIDFQQQENEIAREREDNAVQRRAADLNAAGLSKTLAAGSPASANAMNAPNNQFAAQTGHPMQAFRGEAPEINYDSASITQSLANAEAVKAQAAAVSKDAETKRMAQKFEIFKFCLEHGLSLKEFGLELEKFAHQKSVDERVQDREDAKFELSKFIQTEELDLNKKHYQLSADELNLEREKFNDQLMNSLSEREYKAWRIEYEAASLELDKNADKRAAALAKYQITEIEAKVASYLSQVKLDEAQINYVKKNTSKVVAEILNYYDQHFKIGADIQNVLQKTITEIYNRSVAQADNGKTNDTTVTDSVAAQNAANRDLESKVQGTTSMRQFFSIILFALVGKGGFKLPL